MFSISQHLLFIQNYFASYITFLMVLLHLRYSEVECDSFICFFSLQRSSHSESISSVIHGLFLLCHFPRTSVDESLFVVLKVLVNLSIICISEVDAFMEFPPNTALNYCIRFCDFNPLDGTSCSWKFSVGLSLVANEKSSLPNQGHFYIGSRKCSCLGKFTLDQNRNVVNLVMVFTVWTMPCPL